MLHNYCIVFIILFSGVGTYDRLPQWNAMSRTHQLENVSEIVSYYRRVKRNFGGANKTIKSIFVNNISSNLTEKNNSHRVVCSSPEVLVNGLPSPDIDGTVNGGNEFASIDEIQFIGLFGSMEQKRVCKIKCLNGAWVGPLCALQNGDEFSPIRRDCHLRQTDARIIVTHNGVQLLIDSGDGIAIPHGQSIQSRCEELGLYKFHGNTSMECVDAVWDTAMPYCEATSLYTNFSLDSPPSIVYTIVDGNSGVDSEGQLILVPATIAYFDCLYQRESGEPLWTWTNVERQYNTGWAINTDDMAWKYRLSIYYAKLNDSGDFTCTTPNGKTNHIKIAVKEVECPIIDSYSANRVMSVQSNHMHSKARFSCIEGYYLNGAQEITCLPTGLWSDNAPQCKEIKCPYINVDDDINLRISNHNRSYGSRVYFACSEGYRLIGSESITCANSSWSDAIPHCEPISCSDPIVPKNGRLLESGHHLVGDYVRFMCNCGHVIIGQSLAICLNNGTWSSPPPICKAVCEYPGDLANGHIEPTKFHYNIDEKVTVICHKRYRLLGSPILRCESDGIWSSPKPHCRPLNV